MWRKLKKICNALNTFCFVRNRIVSQSGTYPLIHPHPNYLLQLSPRVGLYVNRVRVRPGSRWGTETWPDLRLKSPRLKWRQRSTWAHPTGLDLTWQRHVDLSRLRRLGSISPNLISPNLFFDRRTNNNDLLCRFLPLWQVLFCCSSFFSVPFFWPTIGVV